MSVFKKIKGIIGDLFVLGIGDTAHGILDNTDGVKIVANDGTTAANAVVARPQGGSQDTHAATYLDLKERVIDITVGFAGATPPAHVAGQYVLCHTSGGGYAAGNIYLDDGVNFNLIPMYHMMCASPRVAVTGTVSMIADGLYLAEGSAAPWTWTLKGDGAATATGLVTAIGLSFDFNDFPGTVSSTTSIPTGAVVIRSLVNVTGAFTPGVSPTLLLEVDGPVTDTTLQLTTDNNLKRVDQYDVLDEIPISDGGPVRLTLAATGAVLAGTCSVQVHYVTPFV